MDHRKLSQISQSRCQLPRAKAKLAEAKERDLRVKNGRVVNLNNSLPTEMHSVQFN